MRLRFLACLVAVVVPAISAADNSPPASTQPSSSGQVGVPHVCPPDKYYPSSEIAAGHSGRILLGFQVAVDGTTKDITILQSSGSPVLDDAAKACVATWLYKPATHDGKPVEIHWEAYVNFAPPPTIDINAPDVPAAALAGPCRLNDEQGNRLPGMTPDTSIKACTIYIRSFEGATGSLLPRNLAWAYNNRGTAYEAKGESDLAVADFSKAISLDGRFVLAYTNRGFLYFKAHQIDLALADDSRAIEIDPKHASAYNNRGNALAEKHEYDRAIADYTRAIELVPARARYYLNRGLTYQEWGKFDLATRDFTSVITLEPFSSEGYLSRGYQYAQMKEYDRAVGDLNQAIKFSPTADAYMRRASVYISMDSYDLGLADTDEAIRLSPDDPDILNRACFARAQANRQLDVALAYCNKSLLLRPKGAETLDSRGLVHLRLGRFDEAIADYDAALALDQCTAADWQSAAKVNPLVAMPTSPQQLRLTRPWRPISNGTR